MTVSFNPSALINSLEYNLHKGVSRSKTDNQKQIEDCMAEADKISEQKSSAYRKEAMVMVAFAVAMVAVAMTGAVIEWKNAPDHDAYNRLYCGADTKVINEIGREARMKALTDKLRLYNSTKSLSNNAPNFIGKGLEAYSHFTKITHNQLDHESQKKNMRLQQLQQERSNSSAKELLDNVKEMKRRQQQAKANAG